MGGLLSMAALAIDVGMLYTARSEAQRVADASALAGAGSFLEAPNDGARARNVAMDYAAQNTVRNQTVNLLPEDVQVDVARWRVTVTVRRTAERGAAVATWFARIFGIDEVGVGATATAEAVPGGAATCLKPFTIPDAWDDTNGNGKYDNGEYYNAGDTGYGSSWRDGMPSNNGVDPNGTTYTNDFGRPLVIKEGTPQQAIVPSWYFPWDVPQPDGGPITGGSNYRDNIAHCNTSVIHLGQQYMVENGNMRGPTKQGINDLVSQDPGAHWDAGADSVVGSAYRPWRASPRVANLPLFDPRDPVDPGKKPVVFNNITAFFIEGMNGNDVIGRFLYATGLGTGITGTGGGPGGPQLKFVRLVD